jgi:hypothetical protein
MVSRSARQDQRERDRLRASRLGGQSVKASFGAVLTRRRYAELVGISLTTVRRWETAGIVRPASEVVLGSPTMVFKPADVEFGRRLATLVRSRLGELSLEDAASAVRSREGS